MKIFSSQNLILSTPAESPTQEGALVHVYIYIYFFFF